MEEEQRWTRQGRRAVDRTMADGGYSTLSRGPAAQLAAQTACVGAWHNVKAWGSWNDSSGPEVAPVSLGAVAWFLNLQDHVTNYFSLSPDQPAFDTECISHADILETERISHQN